MDVQKLATVLRKNGDQVLNATSKLSLSTSLLYDLNEYFTYYFEVPDPLSLKSFQVVGRNSNFELLLDLEFLHDFVQRTISLKISPPINKQNIKEIDIRKFKNLEFLEIRRVLIKDILGIQCLRSQLKYLVCVHSVDNLKALLVDCGGDKSEKYIWNKLKELVLSYNDLSVIDGSLEYVPYLQSLDLSHNKLVNVQAIDCLINLKQLNLSYNLLEAVPLFNKELSKKLQVLVLNNNYIEDLTGLVLLDTLITLDLSFNCLVDHQSLNTIPYLKTLQWLSLEGNPLYFHPRHRSRTASRLHANTSTFKFMLDGNLLTKSETSRVGSYHPSVLRIPGTPRTFVHSQRDHLSSISSTTSVNTHSSAITAIASSELLSRSQSKKGKVRNAIIVEKDDNDEIENPELMESVASVESYTTSSEHLETKKQIEILRNEYGEKWLQSIGGSLVQDLLGIPRTAVPVSSSPYEEDFKRHAAELMVESCEAVQVTNGTNKELDRTDIISDLSTNNTFVTASETSLYEGNDATVITDTDSITTEGDHSEDEGEEHIFLVQVKHNNGELEEIFLNITKKYIKEKDSLNGHILCKWQLELLIKCDQISDNPPTINVEYDTVRRNLKLREYIVSEEDSKQLIGLLNSIINSGLSEYTSFSCLKCSYQFKHTTLQLKTDFNRKTLECPACKSTIICEIDKGTPTNANVAFNKNERAESPSECSIASETESGPLAQICITAEVHSEPTSFLNNCSAVSVQESSCSQMSVDDGLAADNILKKYESDIEVISNPSQSSIEVLDDSTRSRKRSSEERRIVPMPTILDAAVIANSLPVALTESSSSGSITESVCTAYETHKDPSSKPESDLEVHTIQEEEETISDFLTASGQYKAGLISSIIGGLFSGAKEGTKSLAQPRDTNEIEFRFNENFAEVDHRVKFHIYQHIFEDEHEDFVWLLRCSLLSPNTTNVVPACLVLSTLKIYILQIKDHIKGEDVIAWLLKKDSYIIDRLRTIFCLPWKQGIGIEIHGKSNIFHLCILQDMQYTSNFLAFLANSTLPESCKLRTTISERPGMNLQQALLSTNIENSPKSPTICLLSIFSKCIITNNTSNDLSMGILLVTNSHLLLIEDLTWLMPDSTEVPALKMSQPISNLLELETEGNTLEFHFLDEAAGCEEIWIVECATENSMNTIISAVRMPWEQIFAVPLQVNQKIHGV